MSAEMEVERAEIGIEEGRTEFSDYALKRYEKYRNERESLSTSEFTMVIQGYLREYVCIGQCNLSIAAARDPEIKEAIRIYMSDVCYPNLKEMKQILDQGGYKLPVSLEKATRPEEVADIQTNAIDDQMISVAHWFMVMGFMDLWNKGASMSQRTDVRDAFVRNWHRANRWHVASYDMAVEKGFLMPLPTMDAAGMLRTTMMGG